MSIPAPASESGDPRQGFLPGVADLVHRYREPLITLARRKGLRVEDALDCIQETFLTFLALPRSPQIVYDPDAAIRSLTVILTHQIANWRRSAAVRRSARLNPDMLARAHDRDLVAEAESVAQAHTCIQAMSQLQQAVVRLSLLDEVGTGEAARTLGITPGNAAVLLHRARLHLRTCIDLHPPAEQT